MLARGPLPRRGGEVPRVARAGRKETRRVTSYASSVDVSRRQILRMVAAGGVTLGLKVASGLYSARPASAQTAMTPDEAFKALMEGNARFTANQLTSFKE